MTPEATPCLPWKLNADSRDLTPNIECPQYLAQPLSPYLLS